MASKNTPRFSCNNLETFIDKIPGNWTSVKGTLEKIGDSICDDQYDKIVSRKKVVLDDRACKNTMPVLDSWWKGYGRDRDNIPKNFVDAIQKKTTCKA